MSKWSLTRDQDFGNGSGNERQEAIMDAEVFVAVISLAVIALITAGLFERRDASGADGI